MRSTDVDTSDIVASWRRVPRLCPSTTSRGSLASRAGNQRRKPVGSDRTMAVPSPRRAFRVAANISSGERSARSRGASPCTAASAAASRKVNVRERADGSSRAITDRSALDAVSTSAAPETSSAVSGRERCALANAVPSEPMVRATTGQIVESALAVTPALEVECPSNSGSDSRWRPRRYSARGDRQTFAAQTTSRLRPVFSSRTELQSVRCHPNQGRADELTSRTSAVNGHNTARHTRGGIE